jgi:ankyrin repeat protein
LLVLSVLNDDFKTVKLLVDHKAQVNWRDWFNASALMYAASEGDLNIIKYLLERGADIHAKDKHGNTVLSAAKEGNHPEAIKLIKASLNKN